MRGSAVGVLRRSGAMLAAALIVLGLAAARSAPARAQQPAGPAKVEISASVAMGYARMIFTFDQQVPSEVKINGGILIVAFDRPVTASTTALAGQLGDYVTAIRRDPDGKSLRFALGRRATVNSMEAGERLFVDLMPDSWRGPPPGLPAEVVEELTRRAREAERRARIAETQRAARALPPVVIRIGNHPTFSRFVFGLPEPVGVSLDRSGEWLSVRIAKPFTFDLSQARDALPPFVTAIEGHTGTEELVVRMMISPQADVRAFREEGTYVVDLTMPESRPPRAPAAPRPPPAGGASSAAPPSTISLPGASAHGAAVPAPSQAPPSAEPRGQAAEAPAAPAARAPARPAPRAEASRAEAPRPEPRPPVETAQPPPAVPPERPALVSIQARRSGGTLRILVPFTRETPGAVFQRGDTLWLVFDASEPIDLAGLQAESSGAFTSVDAARSREGTAIRIGLDRQNLASASRDGAAWIVTLADTVLEPPRPVTLVRSVEPGNKVIASVEFPQAGRVHRLSDPLAGDELIVVTGQGPARAFIRGHEMVEFAAIAASHGLVFQPHADDLDVSIVGERVEISRPKGLQISLDATRQQGGGRNARRARSIGFDLELWALDEKADFREREADLAALAAAVHETERTARRVDLVRFYMARQRWPEAKAVLDAILRQDPRMAEEGSLQGLRGIVSVMMVRPDDALRDFAHPAMVTSADIGPWRAAALALDRRSREAHEAFEASDTPIAVFPPPLARRVLAHAVGAALDSGAVERASQRLAEMQELGIPSEDEQLAALLRGRVAEAQGRDGDALVAYARAANGPDLPARADAEQRRLALRFRVGQVDIKAATEELEVMSYAWRGDDVEARTLALLARLQAEQGKFRESFSTMRLALRLHPRSEAVRAMQDDVTRHFEALFLDGNADKMKPVDALALYYDFRDLTPQGRRGDEIIRRLADRLASMDLLDQAASLLQHQVDRRLTGAARSQVAARLALVHLMNRKPAAALQVLRNTRLAELPAELRSQRYLLEARALADMGRTDQALEMLIDARTAEAEMLRADILWSAGRHRESAEQSERWLSARAKDAPLNEDERRHLLRAAIGYALSDETLGLDRLRARWRGLMAATPDARAFDVVTSPIEARGVEYREIARSIADRDTLDAFLKSYRERYPAETPGAGGGTGGPNARREPAPGASPG